MSLSHQSIAAARAAIVEAGRLEAERKAPAARQRHLRRLVDLAVTYCEAVNLGRIPDLEPAHRALVAQLLADVGSPVDARTAKAPELHDELMRIQDRWHSPDPSEAAA